MTPDEIAQRAMQTFVRRREAEMLNGSTLFVSGWRIGDSLLLFNVIREAVVEARKELPDEP